MLINTFHKQDHTFTNIHKLYNQITTRVLINNGRFRVVWHSQCNGGQKRERRERPFKLASDMQKDLVAKKKFNSIPITYLMPFKTSKRNSIKLNTFLRP